VGIEVTAYRGRTKALESPQDSITTAAAVD
jgi:hypothetical protein